MVRVVGVEGLLLTVRPDRSAPAGPGWTRKGIRPCCLHIRGSSCVVLVAFYLFSSIKILNEYERAVVFRLGKLLPQPKGPGVVLVFAPIDRMVRVSLRTIVMDVPPQDVITRDNVSVKVNAVVYFRVMDPRRAIVEVGELSLRDVAARADDAAQRARTGRSSTTCCRSARN